MSEIIAAEINLPTGAAAPPDFDFELGRWHVAHRQLKQRLAGAAEWLSFEGTSSTSKLLGGLGIVEENEIHKPDGSYAGIAVRLFDPVKGSWSIYWIDSRFANVEPPVVGRFEQGIGTFLADDVLDGKPIKVRFIWTATNPEAPRWEQAFSSDGGTSWETNWIMDFTRAA
jgi:hypothetical protein